MADFNGSTSYHIGTDKKRESASSPFLSSPSTTIPFSATNLNTERRTAIPNYNSSISSARDSLIPITTFNSERNSRPNSKLTISDAILHPYVLRPTLPVRRRSARAVGRPSPILTRIRSKSNLKVPNTYPPLSPIPPVNGFFDIAAIQHFPELPTKYTLALDLPDTQSRLMTSPRMQGFVTKSYADTKSKRRASKRKSNTSPRSSTSDRFKSMHYGNIPDEELPLIPTLLRSSDLNIERPNVAEQTASLSMSTSNKSSSPTPVKAARESRYLRNAPPPLQLKTSSHRPRSKRYSRRISRESRVSVQSLDSSNSMFPFSPLTPRPKMPSKKEQQRRRLLKLKRTLGEDVPLELITPPPSSGLSAMVMRDLGVFDAPEAATAHTYFDSYAQPLARNPVAMSPVPRAPSTPMISGGRKRGAFAGMRRKKNLLGPVPAAAFEPIRVSVDKNVSSELPRRAPSPPVILISAHPYSNISLPEWVSLDDEDEKLPVRNRLAPHLVRSSGRSASTMQSDDRSSVGSGRSHWPRTPFAHAFEPVPVYLAPPVSSFSERSGNGTTARRSERRQGWSGEWNQPDMQDVIAKLRNM